MDSSCHGLVHDVGVGALIRQETDFKSLNQAHKLNTTPKRTKSSNTINRNRAIIKSDAKCVHFCGRQCIALRGHRDDTSASEDVNKGNFLA